MQETPAIDPSFLPILYEAPVDADWTDERVWRKANPALGDFRSLEDMRIAAARAKEIPAQENTFRRLYLNQWTEQASRWLQMSSWDACQAPIDRAALRGRKCFVGMDLSQTKDLTALVAVFPHETGYDVLPHFFVPADCIRERSNRDRVPYAEWVRQGVLQAIPGPTIDNAAVRQVLQQWAAEFDLQILAHDSWNAPALVQQLEQQDGIVCVPIRQTFPGLTAGTKSLETTVLTRQLRHDGHPVLRWCVSNVAVESDAAGNVKPSKVKSTERIDGVVALIMAVDVMDRNAQAAPTYYLSVSG